MHIIWGDAFVPASPRSASSCAERCFYLPGLMKRNERVADLIEKAGREEAEFIAVRLRRADGEPCLVAHDAALRPPRRGSEMLSGVFETDAHIACPLRFYEERKEDRSHGTIRCEGVGPWFSLRLNS
jgi:hypothetical protein